MPGTAYWLLVGVAAGLCTAVIIALMRHFFAHRSQRRIRQVRCVKRETAKPMPGLLIHEIRTGTSANAVTDKDGCVPARPDWPELCHLEIWKGDRRLLNGVTVDFAEADTVETEIP